MHVQDQIVTLNLEWREEAVHRMKLLTKSCVHKVLQALNMVKETMGLRLFLGKQLLQL